MNTQNARQKADNVAEKIRDHLTEPATRRRLSELFDAAREQLTTSIGEAARITGVKAEKARYVQDAGILSPSRSNENQDTGHRRYSLDQINKLIIVNDLIEHGFSVNDIGRFLDRDQTTVDSLAENRQSSDLATRLREAETTYAQRMLIPRLLYFAQCLLLGDVVNCSVAIILPVATSASDASPISAPRAVERIEDLSRIGPSLVGWHSRSHPYCVLYMQEPRMDDATRYMFRSIDDLCRDAGVTSIDDQPTGAYLLIEREFAHLLDAPTAIRTRLDDVGMFGDREPKRTNPRAVAHRLLRLLRQPANEATGAFGHNYTSVGDGMVYSSPELSSDMVGDKLLTEITELVVRLGNEVSPDASTRRGRWIFSAILLPDDPSLPSGQQSLVVTAQSAKSPHTLGVTRLTPGRNEGLSTQAALSGHMLIRRVMDSNNAAVADIGLEGEPGPALALPIISAHGKVAAVLYVRARHDSNTSANATFTTDDQLLLRVIGHMIGGLVFSYRGNYLSRSILTSMFNEPRNVDRFLQEFKTANAFWADIGDILEAQPTAYNAHIAAQETARDAPEVGGINPMTLLAIDIDGHTNIVNEYGSNTARHLIRAVGRRIAGQPLLSDNPLMSGSDSGRNRLYHIYGDRFFLLLESIRGDEALSYARSLQALLQGSYSLEITRTNGRQTIPIATTTLSGVKVRVAAISYDSEKLNTMLARVALENASGDRTHDPIQYVISLITSALDAGLSQAKQDGLGAGVYLDTKTGLFSPLPKDDGEQKDESASPSAAGVNGISMNGKSGY